jgi:hypothetical protein
VAMFAPARIPGQAGERFAAGFRDRGFAAP